MIVFMVMYGNPADPAAFDKYFEETHQPFVEAIPNLQKLETRKVVGTPDGSDAPYHLIAELTFPDLETFQTSMGSPEGQAAADDVPKFADGGVTMVICES